MQNSFDTEKLVKIQESFNKIPVKYLLGRLWWILFYGVFAISAIYPYIKRYYVYRKKEIVGVRFVGLKNHVYPFFKLQYYQFSSKCSLDIVYPDLSRNNLSANLVIKEYDKFVKDFFNTKSTIILKKRYKDCYDAVIDGNSFLDSAMQRVLIYKNLKR
jgi:hypothetical protein